jgi:PPOX class probable F420-dependent enzyme
MSTPRTLAAALPKEMKMIDLSPFEKLVPLDHGLSVVITRRADHTPHATVANAGVLPHPLTGIPVVAFVSPGSTRKVAHLRADPAIAVVIRAGWQWATVEGTAQVIGPDDPHPEVDDERLRLLLREIFSAAGGRHDDWATYDQVMRSERRAAVLVTPTRTYPTPA